MRRALFPAVGFLLLPFVSQASADSLQTSLYWLTGEIRGEATVLGAQAQQLLADCRDYRDVADELDDLCHDLDRLERDLRRPIRHAYQLDRLGRLAERVDREACDLQEELAEAIAWMERHERRRRVATRSRFVGRGNSFVPRSGLTITLGRGRPSVVFHTAARPVGHGAIALPAPPPAPPRTVNGDLCELTARADRVRALTQQLVRILCP